MNNEFGGDWTTEKLECLRNYLNAYVTIMRSRQYYRITYVDAFAGTGEILLPDDCSDSNPSLFTEEIMNAKAYTQGSTKIALSIDPGFHHYIFIEKSKKKVNELENLRNEFPLKSQKIQIENSDANNFLLKWCQNSKFWETNRAVVFLDPFGMQVNWEVIQAIANTKAIDLWLLFPFIGVNRILTKRCKPKEVWADSLTRTFGTKDWEKEFYKTEVTQTLFGNEEQEYKSANIEVIGNFFIERLKSIFPNDGVCDSPLYLRNSLNSPLYLLCFAAANPKAAKTAVKIAGQIIELKEKRRRNVHLQQN